MTDGHHVEEGTSTDSLLINLSILKSATRNFSDANKLGQGGFGPVYKVLNDYIITTYAAIYAMYYVHSYTISTV